MPSARRDSGAVIAAVGRISIVPRMYAARRREQGEYEASTRLPYTV